jgi:hypothetical protein
MVRKYYVLWYDKRYPNAKRKFTFTMDKVPDTYKRYKMSGHLEWAQKHLSTKYDIPYVSVMIYDDGYNV